MGDRAHQDGEDGAPVLTPMADRFGIVLDVVIPNIYAAGGLRRGDYGFISSGYGGGIDQDQFFAMLEMHGFVQGVMAVDPEAAKTLLGEFNACLMARYPGEVTTENVPWNVPFTPPVSGSDPQVGGAE